MRIYRGIIEGFHGSWGSGLGHLIVSGQAIPCDNGSTVRALEACFGNVIGEGHMVNNSNERARDSEGKFLPGRGFIGRDIVYSYDEFGLVLGGFTPTDDFIDRHVDATIPEVGESLDFGNDEPEEEQRGYDSAVPDYDDPINQG